MTKQKAFLDTTVLVDILLKPNGRGIPAKEALKTFTETELPVYAIKEFKAGALGYFVWMYNKLTSTNSFVSSLAALQSISVTPQRHRTSTALEALKESAEELKKITNEKLAEKYGQKASADVSLADNFRESLKYRIYKAWKSRRKITTKVTQPLNCYPEKEPYEKRGLLKLDPTKCKPERECCLGQELRNNRDKLSILQATIRDLPGKTENTRRHVILKEIARKPKQAITEEYCRGLGDAYFALFCPEDSVILTTNISDHKPLAEALGKEAETPLQRIEI
jgi:DNA primase